METVSEHEVADHGTPVVSSPDALSEGHYETRHHPKIVKGLSLDELPPPTESRPTSSLRQRKARQREVGEEPKR